MNEVLQTVQWVLLREHGLRAGWRLGLHLALAVVAVVFAVLVVAGVVLGWNAAVGHMPSTLQMLGVQAFATVFAFLVLHVISAVLLDARWGGERLFVPGRLVAAGLGGPVLRSLGELVGGVLLGALAILPALGVMAFAGLQIEPVALTGERVLGFVLVSLVLVAAAAFEELAFRGYAWLWLGASLSRLLAWLAGRLGLEGAGAHKLADVIGFGLPTIAINVLFGAVHWGNPNATFLSSFNTVLAGLWLAVLILRTRSLWAAIGAHFAWNHFHGLVLGFPLSGLSEAMPTLLQSRGMDPVWLGGGEYGVEGGIGATLSCLLLLVVCALLPRRKAPQAHAAMVWPGPVAAPDSAA